MAVSFAPEQMMEEVHKRPGLWKSDMLVDRLEKLTLWKEVGAALYKDWDSINKATAYDRVLQLQKKWRSYKDAYNRELRRRRGGSVLRHRVYVYFDKLKFLGGYEGLAVPPERRDEFETGDDQAEDLDQDQEDDQGETAVSMDIADPLTQKEKRKRKKQKAAKRRRRTTMSYDFDDTEQVEMTAFPIETQAPPQEEDDSDKLFLLSFVPEMKKLHPNIKMWVRSQIANTMQEAVRSHFSSTMPAGSNVSYTHEPKLNIKRQRDSSTE